MYIALRKSTRRKKRGVSARHRAKLRTKDRQRKMRVSGRPH